MSSIDDRFSNQNPRPSASTTQTERETAQLVLKALSFFDSTDLPNSSLRFFYNLLESYVRYGENHHSYQTDQLLAELRDNLSE